MNRFSEFKKYLWRDGDEPDVISSTLFNDMNELFGMDDAEVRAWQLGAARKRFDSQVESIRALAAQAETAGMSRIDTLDDVVPLLFQHTQYKSYPMSLLEKGRFDMLTKWLGGLTSVDLSKVDASSCDSIDGWLELLETKTSLQPYHTSGTTGKLSFYPRTAMERDFIVLGTFKIFEAFGDEPDAPVGFDHERIPVIFPSWRHGRTAGQRMINFFGKYVAPSEQECYALTDGTLSADLVSLSGRIRVAQAKGELDKLQLTDGMRVAFKRYLDELERQPAEVDRFMNRMMDQLKGRRVFIFQTTNYLIQAAKEGLKRGISGVFAPDSLGLTGGGGKGLVLPDNWREMISEFTGIASLRIAYGMTEINGSMPQCREGYYHIPPYFIPFLLDPESGKALPREGRQTGRFAFLDLTAQTYWGGTVTGDKVTIEWDRKCPCGRKGAHIHDNVTRYSEAVTGDDKVTCSATIDNTNQAIQALLGVQ